MVKLITQVLKKDLKNAMVRYKKKRRHLEGVTRLNKATLYNQAKKTGVIKSVPISISAKKPKKPIKRRKRNFKPRKGAGRPKRRK